MCNRIAQLIERGTAFRRACLWTINTISNAGALGVEVTVAGKLRSERAHFEKHTTGILPKSGDIAERVVKVGVTHVRTKMGLMGIQLKIAMKDEIPQEFEYSDTSLKEPKSLEDAGSPEKKADQQTVDEHAISNTHVKQEEKVVAAGRNPNEQS
jgi:small subunit ribosomal protein S3